MAGMESQKNAAPGWLGLDPSGAGGAVVIDNRVVELARSRQRAAKSAMAEFARRQDLNARLNAIAEKAVSAPDVRRMWRHKAQQALYLPRSQLTARPASAPVNFSPDGYEPRKRSVAWVIWLLLLVAAAIAVTPLPPGWL